MSIDREYRIKIDLEANNAAAEQSSQTLKDVGKSAEHAGGQMEGLNSHGREFHELCHKLNGVLPGLGDLLKVAFNPETIAVAGMIAGIEAIKGAMESYEKKLEEIVAAAEKADFAENFQAAQETARAAVTAAEEYRRKLDEISKGEHGIKAELEGRLKLMAAIQAAQQQEAESKKTLAVAQLAEDEAEGRVNKSEAIIRRGEIEKRFAEDQARAREEAFTKEQQIRAQALDKAAKDQAGLDKAVEAATQKLGDAKRLKDFTKNPPTREAVSAAQEKADEAREVADTLASNPSDSNMPQIRESEAAAQHYQQKADLLERQYQQSIEAGKINVESLQNDLAAKQQEAQKNKDSIANIRDQMNSANANETDWAVTRSRANTKQTQMEAVDSQITTDLISRGRDLQKEFQEKGNNMPPEDARELIQVLQAVAQYIRDQNGNYMTRQQVQAEMKALLRTIESKGK